MLVLVRASVTYPGSSADIPIGRFFAVTELKAMLAHVVLNYDVKLEHEGVRPPDQVFETVRNANPKAKVWFRKREF